MANNIKTRISLIKSFIARSKEGQERLNQNYENYQSELNRQRLENINNL